MLTAVQEKLLARELFEEFCRDFTAEMNRLRMEGRAAQSANRHELARVEREIAKLIQALKEGMPGRQIRAEMTGLVERQEQLERELQEAPDPKPLLHPGMADLFREKVYGLREALEQEDARPKAAEAIRGLLEGIVLEPEGDHLRIVVQGKLAAMLAIAQNAKRPSDSDDLKRAVALVAGARSQRYRRLSSDAA